MTYYLLIQLEDNRWTPQFGDKDKETVEFERDDMSEHRVPRKHLKIIKAKSARRKDCEAAVEALNAKEGR